VSDEDGFTDWLHGPVAVVGLGLIGGSLAGALASAGVPVYGVEPLAGARRLVRRRGWAERLWAAPGPALARCPTVVVCVPTGALESALAAIGDHLAPGAVVTTVAGQLAGPAEALRRHLPPSAHGIAGHPMAGSERSGAGAARADLYAGAVWAVARPRGRGERPAAARVRALARRVGARPRPVDPDRHDAAMAWVSHLPYLVSAALARAVAAGEADGLGLASLAGPALRDTTRVAASPAWMAQSTVSAPPAARARALAAFDAAWRETLALLEAEDADRLGELAERSAAARRLLLAGQVRRGRVRRHT
jgi:prephenate dehydrogenase